MSPTEAGLVGAILATCFCCQPLGIVAIVFAALAMSRPGPERQGYAEQARQWTTRAVVAGLVWIALAVVLFLLPTAMH